MSESKRVGFVLSVLFSVVLVAPAIAQIDIVWQEEPVDNAVAFQGAANMDADPGEELVFLRGGYDGAIVILDGATGRVIVDPTAAEIETYRRSALHTSERERRLEELACCVTQTTDGVRVILQANLDQPDDAAAALRGGAEGVGLFRSEFLVIGRRAIPHEDEQYEAYRRVVEAFPDFGVTLRTFDIGGDKFPIFLPMPKSLRGVAGHSTHRPSLISSTSCMDWTSHGLTSWCVSGKKPTCWPMPINTSSDWPDGRLKI